MFKQATVSVLQPCCAANLCTCNSMFYWSIK